MLRAALSRDTRGAGVAASVQASPALDRLQEVCTDSLRASRALLQQQRGASRGTGACGIGNL